MKRIVFVLALISVSLPVFAGYKIIGNNDSITHSYTSNLAAAKQHLMEVAEETKRSEKTLKSYKLNGLTPEVPAQGQKFIKLKEKGNAAFGDASFIQPFGQCGVLGSTAWSYWESRRSNAGSVASMRKLYMQTVDGCRNQIATKPESTATVEVSPASEKPPFKDCLEVLDVSDDQPKVSTWTCPARVIRKIK